jgi:hypothetical protein
VRGRRRYISVQRNEHKLAVQGRSIAWSTEKEVKPPIIPVGERESTAVASASTGKRNGYLFENVWRS